jgi:GNAT superfamily N-acetyltransferase
MNRALIADQYMLYPAAMNAIAIREAVEDDLPGILHLYAAGGINTDGNFTPEEAREHFAVFRRYPDYRIYVALLAEQIVGTYELLIMDNLAKRGRKSGVIEDVAVDPAYQGRGIGRAMMHHARALCKEAGCYKLMLSSNLKREEAHRFYDALGFTRHGYSFLVEL